MKDSEKKDLLLVAAAAKIKIRWASDLEAFIYDVDWGYSPRSTWNPRRRYEDCIDLICRLGMNVSVNKGRHQITAQVGDGVCVKIEYAKDGAQDALREAVFKAALKHAKKLAEKIKEKAKPVAETTKTVQITKKTKEKKS